MFPEKPASPAQTAAAKKVSSTPEKKPAKKSVPSRDGLGKAAREYAKRLKMG
jgi:hypothetical protein